MAFISGSDSDLKECDDFFDCQDFFGSVPRKVFTGPVSQALCCNRVLTLCTACSWFIF